jgi:hypothetical protein
MWTRKSKQSVRDLQSRIQVWEQKNFPGKADATTCLLGAIEEIGELCVAHLRNAHTGQYDRRIYLLLKTMACLGCTARGMLKSYQGIRGSNTEHAERIRLGLQWTKAFTEQLQKLYPVPPEERLLAVTVATNDVDLTELVTKECTIEDCVGDVHIYLTNYCSHAHIDHQAAIETAAREVLDRDWRTNPVTGHAQK